jgi:hypothetical protein
VHSTFATPSLSLSSAASRNPRPVAAAGDPGGPCLRGNRACVARRGNGLGTEQG